MHGPINVRNKSTISRKLLKMDVLTFETCWAVNSEIIKASDIKLVYHYSTIKMMHGPRNIRNIRERMFTICVTTTLRALAFSVVLTLLEKGPYERFSPVSPIRDKYGVRPRNQTAPSFPYRISEFPLKQIYDLEVKHSKQFRVSSTWEISLLTLTVITNA